MEVRSQIYSNTFIVNNSIISRCVFPLNINYHVLTEMMYRYTAKERKCEIRLSSQTRTVGVEVLHGLIG